MGSCWPRRTGQDTSRHTAAGGQRSDSDPQRFFSTGSSAAEAAVLQGESLRIQTMSSWSIICGAWYEMLSGMKRFAEVSPSNTSSKIQNPNVFFSTNVKHATETQETAHYTETFTSDQNRFLLVCSLKTDAFMSSECMFTNVQVDNFHISFSSLLWVCVCKHILGLEC